MNTKAILEQTLEKIRTILSAPIPEAELSNGWTADSWCAMSKAFDDLADRIESGKLTRKDLNLNYPRGLDSWGVFRGPVYDLITDINVAASVSPKPSA